MMNNDEIAARLGFANPSRFGEMECFLLDGLPLYGRRVLDVGCGRGAVAIWAVLNGASSVVALEPELAGSMPGASATLGELIVDLDLGDRIELRCVPLASYEDADQFDLAVLNNVINHLNEAAVVRLHRDEDAIEEYVQVLQQLRSLLRRDAFVIVADCARRSIWKTIGREGPWTHDIEWEKHQQPRMWIDVFRRAGFEPHDIRWTPLRGTGRLTGNRFVQYFTLAHFVLRLRAV